MASLPAIDSRRSILPTDWLIAGSIMAITMLYVFLRVAHPIVPMEDASMLLRYAQHVAAGYGIVWNVGEHPVEGATDFLFMIFVGGLSKLFRIEVKTAAETILLTSQVLSTGLLYLSLRRFYQATRPLAAVFAILLGFGMGYRFVNTGFSAPFYALFALLTWLTGLLCIEKGVSWRRAFLFSVLAFATGLIRPDGALLAVFLLASTLFALKDHRLRLILCFGIVFAVCGGIYFGWRIKYFGYLFPNPFYIKKTGGLSLSNLATSLRCYIQLLLPVLPLAGFGLLTAASRRRLLSWLITVVPFISIWMLVSLDNNHFSRFQYVLVPISMLELAGMAAMWWRSSETARTETGGHGHWNATWVLLLFFCTTLYYNANLYLVPYSNAGGQQLAARLHPYAPKHYTMMVTEAGDLPFYSEWRTIDLFGLNDEYIAHHNGVITSEYIVANKPEIILYRDLAWTMRDLPPATTQQPGATSGMGNKLTVDAQLARDYAVAHGYILAAKWGARYCDYHTYWVKPDFPDSAAIVSAIRDHPYYSQVDGQLSFDFRNAPQPSVPCDINAYPKGLFTLLK